MHMNRDLIHGTSIHLGFRSAKIERVDLRTASSPKNEHIRYPWLPLCTAMTWVHNPLLYLEMRASSPPVLRVVFFKRDRKYGRSKKEHQCCEVRTPKQHHLDSTPTTMAEFEHVPPRSCECW
mmetsp:Transcript_25995/g.35765  ORF Transcript_25995/g.35765 Transcript_25995/m.35765 type:complete len:122 (-) Transcript_25995:283-648(-)